MLRIGTLIALIASACMGQAVLTSPIDYSGATSTKTVKAGTAAPGTCAVGELFIDTDAVAGQGLLLCTATNTWTVQYGGVTLLQTQTASTSASLVFTCPGNTAYDHFLIEFVDIVTTSAANLVFVAEVSTDGGSTWESTNYSIVQQFTRTTTGSAGSNFATANIPISGGGNGLSGYIEFWKPSATSNRKRFDAVIVDDQSGGDTFVSRIGGTWRGTVAFTAIRLRVTTSSMATGTGYCYGYAK